jgi:transposase
VSTFVTIAVTVAQKPKHPPREPMTLGNMRELGVKRLIASCLNDGCRHTALIEVWSYPAETEIPYFKSRVVCAKCGACGNKIDVRPNWKEQPSGPSLVGKEWS